MDYSHSQIPVLTWTTNSSVLPLCCCHVEQVQYIFIKKKQRNLKTLETRMITIHTRFFHTDSSSSRTVSLASPPVAQQVPGETSPAVFWVFPLPSSHWSESSGLSPMSRRCIPARHRSRAFLSLPSLQRLIANRCWFMCCWLSCLPSRQMCCRNRALSRWDPA